MGETSSPQSHPGLRAEYYRVLRRRRLESELDARPTITIEDVIAEMKAHSNGPDRPPEFYEAVRRHAAEAQAEKTAGLLQPLIDDITNEIHSRLAERGMTLAQPVFVGQFPHGSFNAQSRRAEEGVLILINTGLFMLIYQTLKVANLATRFNDADENGRLVRHPDVSDVPVDAETITALLTDSVLAYVMHGDSTLAQRLPALGGVRGELQSRLVRACEMFAIGHEFGHVLEGHLSEAQPGPTWTPTEYVRKDHVQEFHADEVGAALLISGLYAEGEDLASRKNPSEEDLETFRVRAWTDVAGPLIFFAISDLVDEVRQRVRSVPTSEPPEVSTHPPASERYAKVRSLIERQNVFDLSVADLYIGFFDFQKDLVVAEARRRFGESRVGAGSP